MVARPMTWLLLAASTAILALAFLLRRHVSKRLAGLDVTGEVVYGDDGAVVEVLVCSAGNPVRLDPGMPFSFGRIPHTRREF